MKDPVQSFTYYFHGEAHSRKRSHDALLSSKTEGEGKLMMCYRNHITPSKIYCFGPKEELPNCVVKHDKQYASGHSRFTLLTKTGVYYFLMLSQLELDKGSFLNPLKLACIMHLSIMK